MQKPVEKPIKFIKNLSTKGKSYPITHISAVIDDDGESVKSTIDSLKNKSSMTKVTWQELKDKRNAGKLIPGTLYRITDYQCTTTQENTRSAGHQFDIVLLALSENKLAEEGWAMMHENIYNVKFSDGRKKCYIAKDTYYSEEDEDEVRNIVDLETGLGVRAHVDYLEIDEENKEANYPFNIVCLSVEDLQYNYFQNSKLEAWKVWYCLDNDKSRFAWADDSVDEGSPASIIDSAGNLSYIRNSARDEQNYFAWEYKGNNIYTETSTPSIGDTIYLYDHGMIDPSPGTVASYTPPTQGTNLPNGRGVIYRLVDEFNNDIPCDFKNILVILKAVESYIITAINHIDNHQDYSMRGSIRDITVSLCLINDDTDNYKNAIPVGRIVPALRTGEVLYNIKISSSALEDARQLTDISSNTIIGYTIFKG